jgi:hypothetical protein
LLDAVGEPAHSAEADGALSAGRANQIDRHVKRALGQCEQATARRDRDPITA